MDTSNPKTPLIEAIVEWKMNLFSKYHFLEGKWGDELKTLCDLHEVKLRRELEKMSVEALGRGVESCKFDQMLLAL